MTSRTDQNEENTEIEKQSHITYASHNELREKFDDKTKSEIEKTQEGYITRYLLDKIICTETLENYSHIHEYNTILYLHFKSIKYIDNWHTFTNWKAIYLEGNKIEKIQNLSCLRNLTSLYLHENTIKKIEGWEKLQKLEYLNWSDNLITTIENLSDLPLWSNWILQRNRIGVHGWSDVKHILELSDKWSVLDLTGNKISDINFIDEVALKKKSINVLYWMGNECVRHVANYRKKMIGEMENLTFWDEKPVFEDEKRFAIAFMKGGFEEERKERNKYQEEQRELLKKRNESYIRRFGSEEEKYNWDNGIESHTRAVEKTEEEKEKEKLDKLDKLKALKEKNTNEIFKQHEIRSIPNPLKSDINPHSTTTTPPEPQQEKQTDHEIQVYQPREDNPTENESGGSTIPPLNEPKNEENNIGVKIRIADLDELD